VHKKLSPGAEFGNDAGDDCPFDPLNVHKPGDRSGAAPEFTRHGPLPGHPGVTIYLYSMPVTVVPMRKRGVPINPHMREPGEFVGRLRMYDYDDPVLHRRVRKVDLLELGRAELINGLGDHGRCAPVEP